MEGKSFDQFIGQIRDFAAGLTLRQKFMVAGGALLMAVTLAAFTFLMGKPDYKTLYSGLKATDAQSITSKLSVQNLPFQLSPDGSSILVPADQLDRARMETASQGLPRNARLGYEIFDTPNWMGTDFTDKINYQRALEGELERTIQTLAAVESARVHLVLAEESLFTEQERPAKAAVILKTKNGRLPSEEQFAIAQLVASAVDQLRPENVSVLDADSGRPLNHGIGSMSVGAGGPGEQLAEQIKATLAPVVGEEHIRASVNVEYDLNSSEHTEENYDPKSAVALTMQRSEEASGGVITGGVPGTTSNVPSAQGFSAAKTGSGSDQQSSRAESESYAVNKSVRHTLEPAGKVKRVAAAVLIDDDIQIKADKTQIRRKRTAEEMKNLEQLASAAIGLNPERGDLIAIENLTFQQPQQEAPAKPTTLDKFRGGASKWAFAIRYVAFGLLFCVVYFVLLRPVKKQMLDAFRQIPDRVMTVRAGSNQTTIEAGASEELTGNNDVKRLAGLKKQVVEKVRGEPSAAGRLVQNWIRESAS